MESFIITCPQCNEPVLIEKVNCSIFRHGVLIENGAQIDPHASVELCTYYITNNRIYGCGKPFKLVKNEEGKFVAIVCEYI